MFILNGEEVKITRFPDNTIKFDLASGPKKKNILKWKFESMEELIVLIGLSDKLNTYETDLQIPYLPNARMDKVSENTEGLMLQYFVQTVDNLGFNSITVLDPHSIAYSLFAKNTNWKEDEYKLRNLIYTTIKNVMVMNEYTNPVLVFPDKGAKSRYTELIGETEEYSTSALVGEKVRNQKTGEIISFDLLGEVPEDDVPVLIVDDICSFGGTFLHTAKKLREKGYKGKIYLYVTHAEESILLGEITDKNSPISRVFTTDSLLESNHEKVIKYNI